MREIIFLLLRHLTGAGAGYLVGKGLVDADTAQAISGGVLGVGVLVTSYIDKRKRKK